MSHTHIKALANTPIDHSLKKLLSQQKKKAAIEKSYNIAPKICYSSRNVNIMGAACRCASFF
jgi:hypothetical protein